MEERLQKILARAGFASRRGAEGIMQEGRVTVNGAVVRELGTKADVSRDDIRVDGVRVKGAGEPVYIVLNKPRGVVTTRRDPSGRPTVMDLVPGVKGLFPVGRLDLTTEGLILLTNDGEFAERVSHPRFEVPRVYHAKVRGIPDQRTLARLRRGVRIKDEIMVVDRVKLIEVDRHAWVEVVLHEGKQHEVKRLLEAVGHPVSKLRRVAFGPVTLRSLPPGRYRTLEPAEVKGLLRGAPSKAVPRPRTRRRPRTMPRKDDGRQQGPSAARGNRLRKTAARGGRDAQSATQSRAGSTEARSHRGGRKKTTARGKGRQAVAGGRSRGGASNRGAGEGTGRTSREGGRRPASRRPASGSGKEGRQSKRGRSSGGGRRR